MTRVGVYLTVAVVVPPDTTRKFALPPTLALSRATVWHVRDLLGGSGGTPLSGEPVVTWRDADGTLRVVAHRTGRMSFSELNAKPPRVGGGPALLGSGLTAAFGAGLKFEWPPGVTSDSIVFDLTLESGSTERGEAERPRPNEQEPVFTVLKPWVESSRQTRPPRISYPPVVRGQRVEGTVHLTFIVDSTGRADLDTVKDIWPIGRPRLTGEEGRYYDAFVEAVRRGLGTARYAPAKVGGCAVPIWVRQAFEFNPRSTSLTPTP